MRQEEFLFLIEEIGVSLRLSQNAISLIIEYYLLLINSENNRFRSEIVVGACIFLVSKTREENKKIRDIINMCFVITAMYKHSNFLLRQKEKQDEEERQKMIQNNHQEIQTQEKEQEDEQQQRQGDIQYLKLSFLKELERNEIEKEFAPTFTLDIYSKIKNEILQCEQYLLRLINYNLLTKKMSFSEIVLNYIHIFEFDKKTSQYILDLSNDTQYIDFSKFTEVEMAKGCIYLSLDLIKNYANDLSYIIDDKFYDFKWWKEFMLIDQSRLLEFSEMLLSYYDDINS